MRALSPRDRLNLLRSEIISAFMDERMEDWIRLTQEAQAILAEHFPEVGVKYDNISAANKRRYATDPNFHRCPCGKFMNRYHKRCR